MLLQSRSRVIPASRSGFRLARRVLQNLTVRVYPVCAVCKPCVAHFSLFARPEFVPRLAERSRSI
jgi:hypothetical protein